METPPVQVQIQEQLPQKETLTDKSGKDRWGKKKVLVISLATLVIMSLAILILIGSLFLNKTSPPSGYEELANINLSSCVAELDSSLFPATLAFNGTFYERSDDDSKITYTIKIFNYGQARYGTSSQKSYPIGEEPSENVRIQPQRLLQITKRNEDTQKEFNRVLERVKNNDYKADEKKEMILFDEPVALGTLRSRGEEPYYLGYLYTKVNDSSIIAIGESFVPLRPDVNSLVETYLDWVRKVCK